MNKPVDTHLPLADARRLTQRVHFERDGTVTIASGPDEGVTSGSLSIQDGGKGLRKACAELRELLRRSGKRSYWELEIAGDIPADAPEMPPAEYRIVGKSIARLELPAKIAGRPSYVQD